jgi:hypothetical protein
VAETCFSATIPTTGKVLEVVGAGIVRLANLVSVDDVGASRRRDRRLLRGDDLDARQGARRGRGAASRRRPRRPAKRSTRSAPASSSLPASWSW